MISDVTHPFAGFPDFRSNVTFVPIQFFTVVIPNVRGGTIRLVAYMLRQVLGWVDTEGNPTRAQLQFSYAELAEQAGLSRAVVVAPGGSQTKRGRGVGRGPAPTKTAR